MNKASIGVIAVVLSVSAIIVMAEIRTDGYNHAHKAVSELGSLDAPHKWVFNILGYFIPGVLLALFSFNLKNHFVIPMKSYSFYFLLLSGLLWALAGIFPADMDHKNSFCTVMHIIGSMGSGLFWLLSALTLWWQLKKDNDWKAVAIITVIIPFITIFIMGFIPAHTPGISQRVGFGGYYIFILVLSIKQWTQLNAAKSKPER
jgi:hypothetical membrane protein